MDIHPPSPRVVHPLPPAPNFVGREEELEALHAAWGAGARGVVALVGLGGAGKTAVAARFLDSLRRRQTAPRPAGLFVWSVYQEPDAGLFLQEAWRYFAGRSSGARGAGLLHLLRDALETGGPHLLVLDGLERVQRQEDGGAFGRVEDPLLKGLLTRAAEGMGRTTVLVTSRFPLTDLEAFRGNGYRHLDVGGLDLKSAVALLHSRGVWGEDEVLARLVEQYGAHALTLDHLGGLIGQFLGGDPSRAPELPALASPGTDRQAFRLARLLRAYEEHLPPAELALLSRMCLLRRSLNEEQVLRLFLCAPAVHARTARELKKLAAVLSAGAAGRVDVRPDLVEGICEAVEEALARAPLAGPEEAFRQEIRLTAETGLDLYERDAETDFAALARLYAGAATQKPSEERPLSARDRATLQNLMAHYDQLRQHPLLPFKKVPPAELEAAFAIPEKMSALLEAFKLGGKVPAASGAPDLGPADVLRAYTRVRRALGFLAVKHFVLGRVRELCRLYQQKWSLAGPLAACDASEFRRALGSLAGRHLVLREGDDSYSVHPAVRDHFRRLATAGAGNAWHDLIREQLISLVLQPGKQLPEDAASLDLVEEAIHHANEAGRPDEAFDLYNDVLGGLRHLGWKLGESARGLRVLKSFSPCPDRWALAWYLRSLGEFEEALAHGGPPYFRADVRLLQGRLPEVAAEGDETRAAVARFLMGQTTRLPPDCLGGVVPRDHILIYLGRLDRAKRSRVLESFYKDIGWESDRARCRLLMAEVARRRGDELAVCRGHLEKASHWVLHSGSVEHLCLMHLVRARLAGDAGDGEAAQRAITEGLHLARQCGLGLYHVELLCVQAEILLARADAPAAEAAAADALWRAAADDCRFAWGEAESRHLLGQALAAQHRDHEARAVFDRALDLRRRIGDPRAEQTGRALAALPT